MYGYRRKKYRDMYLNIFLHIKNIWTELEIFGEKGWPVNYLMKHWGTQDFLVDFIFFVSFFICNYNNMWYTNYSIWLISLFRLLNNYKMNKSKTDDHWSVTTLLEPVRGGMMKNFIFHIGSSYVSRSSVLVTLFIFFVQILIT